MAKTAWINRNERKRVTVKKYAALRAELKAKKDYAGLAQLPRDASPSRVVNRCKVTGRRRAFIRRFKISRLTFRELATTHLNNGKFARDEETIKPDKRSNSRDFANQNTGRVPVFDDRFSNGRRGQKQK